MQYFDVPLFDDDIYKLLLRLAINLVILVVIVQGIYFPHSKRKKYVFSFYMINIIVFFICFTLKKFDLELGLALGLFAIFGILRYRTDPIPIKEMTYLFVVLGIAVINSLANKKMSLVELSFTNIAIMGLAFTLEKLKVLRPSLKKEIVYEKIEFIRPGMERELIADLENRTGLKILSYEIGKVDFLRDVANIRIYYEFPLGNQYPEKNSDTWKMP